MVSPNKLAVIRRRLTPLLNFLPYLIFTLIGLGILLFIHFFLPPVLKFVQEFLPRPSALFTFTKDPVTLLKSTSDRTNILLLGIGGTGHEGPLLTDSMIVISYHHPSHKLSLISIPRDLWIDSMKAKINTAYYYGDLKQPDGGGLILAKSATNEAVGLPIHYAFVIDFEGFKKAIDLVGGLDITVDRTFDDYKYPIPGKEAVIPESDRYEHLHFDAGPQHLDGDLALKYVRSRYAEGEEGTDFARSARQQKVILAFKNKLLSQKTLLDPQKISDLLDLYQQYIATDIQKDNYPAFAKLTLSADTSSLKSVLLTEDDPLTGQTGILYSPKNTAPYQGQYVLLPKDNNWSALHQYLQNNLNQ